MSLPSDIESAPSPAVRSLRSRFEQLAVDTSVTQPRRPVSSRGFLLPPSPGPRPRAASGSSDLHPDSSNSSNHLRTSSSSSDLKGTRRPPPPLPAPRSSSRPPSPTSSFLRPSHVPLHHSPPSSSSNVATYDSTHNLSNSPTMKLPPPTPHFHADSELNMPHVAGLSINRFSVSSKSDLTQVGGLPRIAPPRPPPRPKSTVSSQVSNNPLVNGLSHIQTPPPLPARRATATPNDELSPTRRHTPRNQTVLDASVFDFAPSLISALPSSALAIERKAFGVLPPPPKRQIGLGDELPELKRPYLSDSSDDEEEEEIKAKADLPDTSRSSRRPPHATFHKYTEQGINVQAFHGTHAVAGHVVVVGSGHSIKFYDLSVSDSPVWSLDSKDIAPDHRSRKVTSLEFRLPSNNRNRGHLVWIGTKEGHLFEVDVRTANLVSAKMAAHAQAVSHIFRYGYSMVTIDDNGKVLVFSPESGEDVVLSKNQPRVMRIADKQTFISLIGGVLWTSARETHGGTGTFRGPVVRVYDVFSPGSTGKSLLPTEHVGTVTCGTILPSTPNLVYLGHEGGNVTVWSLNPSKEGAECINTIKVSMSDILCLAGVNERLWTGARTGHIAAYDVTVNPWVMTNCWMAHNSLPVSAIFVDPWSIEKVGKLCAVSVGRDEKLNFWDGLLANDWVDQELIKREASYSTYRKLSVLIVSWNIDANKPDALHGDAENFNFLQNVLTGAGVPDIISFGFQEVVDLESRRTAAKSVLLGGKTKANDGSISQKVSTAYKKWHDQLVLSVRLAMPPDVPYTVVHTESLVGLYTCILVKNSERIVMKDIHINTIKRGMGGKFGNKGAIIGRFIIDDSSLCFINCHLAAGQHQTRQRGRDIAAILEERALFPENSIMEPVAFTNGGDGSMVLDHEIVFFSGDMNYRIEQRRDVVIASIRSGEHQAMLNHDQLLKEMKFNRGFRLRSFLEGPIRFIPTYKYDRGTDEFDTSHKRRIPAWCDRILWRSLDHSRVKQTQYRRWEANISDHRPISGAFELMLKSINHELRVAVKTQVEQMWRDHEKQLLGAARQFYMHHLLL